ncbi:hypothetical protein JB92DRAFT_3130874 [Gautieria morchelliformis]|nr:hypothetical protein JB92DRAFT_3130874 [Gautieria morchelliformis]
MSRSICLELLGAVNYGGKGRINERLFHSDVHVEVDFELDLDLRVLASNSTKRIDSVSDDDRDQDDDDVSGDFQPSRRPAANQRRATANPRPVVVRLRLLVALRVLNRPSHHLDQKLTVAKTTRKVLAIVVSMAAPIARWHAFTTLRTATVKAIHAVQEWKWLEDGVISREEARWHLEVFGGKEHFLRVKVVLHLKSSRGGPTCKCHVPYGALECSLKRHMEHGTCKWGHLNSGRDHLDNRQLKAKIVKESDKKYERFAAGKHA